TIDVKDMFFMFPLKEADWDRFAFTCEGKQYTFTHLPQRYQHSPTLVHHAPAHELAQIASEEETKVYQYIDDILIGESDVTTVDQTQTNIITHLESLELPIPTEKVQFPSSDVKFLGILWKGGAVCIPSEILTTLEQVKMLESKKELQHALGFLFFWRKHVLDFSIIA
ncbi:POL5 protein, partial [Sclerurus mexicanus]|nr:POL5 protein [Sclerurus mexicanus]